MGTELRALLDELEQRLDAFGAPIAGAFRPGAAPERVRELLAAEGVPPHEDLVTWWSWHDGVEIGASPVKHGPGIWYRAENTVIGPWHVLSLADMVRIRRWYRETYDEAGLGHLLPASWAPVLTTDGAGELCADAAAGGRAPLHILGEGYVEPPPPQFASLAELVELVLAVFDEGLIVPGPQDPHAPWADAARLTGDKRRLAYW